MDSEIEKEHVLWALDGWEILNETTAMPASKASGRKFKVATDTYLITFGDIRHDFIVEGFEE